MSNPKQPALVVTGGPLNNKSVLLTGATGERLLGSGAQAHFHLEAPNVEAAHAKVRWNETGVFLDDLSQQLGTFLNGTRFQESCALGDGDRIWLGPPGDHNSVRVMVFLPGHPRDFSEAGAPLAPAVPEPKKEQWGALDDDEKIIEADAAHPQAGAKAKAEAAKVVPVAGAHPPQPLPKPRMVTARPPVPRAILVGVGAVVLGALGFLWYSRSQAPAPVLQTLLPPKAEPGQTVQITGTGFEAKPEDNIVTFGDKRAEVTAAGETQLSATVPGGLSTADKPQHRVRVQARGASSNTLFFRLYFSPKVAAFEPDVAMPGDVVKAIGEHFGEDTTIMVGGTAAEILEVQPKQLRFRMPKVSVQPGKAIAVGVQVGNNAARPATLLVGKLPLVLEVAPARGLPGDRVTLKGRGFDAAPGGSAAWFGGKPALVLAASERELQVVVPGAGQLTGPSEVNVSVRALGSTSSLPVSFSVTRPSTAVFVPRFFAEPGPDPETVFVSSDLGPFLRLRGKADAQSAAERAARAAVALNGLLEQALRGPVTLELREKPQPGVSTAGAAQLLVAAMPEDGMAYEGAHPTPRALARYWTALLQDYTALFAQKQRPFRVLELSPRGQALLELYAAAERRAGVGAGVPTSVVENLAPSQVRAIAEMALLVPGETQFAGGAAVAGRWDGTLEETGHATRAIQVRIRATAGALSGTLSTRAGAVSGELPLQEPAYKEGALRFVVKLGAAPLHFAGKLDGRSVSGEVQSAGGKPVGRFSLRWVE